jgi:FdrA protein
MHKVVANLYRDSVSLMQLSAALAKMAGVEQASAIMATPANLELLREAGLMDGKLAASPNDLLVAVRGKSAAPLQAAIAAAVAALDKPPERSAGGGPGLQPPRSQQMALAQAPHANLALISVPGEYAAAEAMKALRLGLHVMLFSDNVSLADEISLKQYARERKLLVMGPDCGTAIIDGIPLGFANAVRRGAIGVVGASGTGTQQHAIGTGGHDLHRDVGGITMLQGLERLARDKETKAIVLISKPPAPEVADAVLDAARRAGKPVVVNFVGSSLQLKDRNLFAVKTLEEAARAAVALAAGKRPPRASIAASKVPRVSFKKSQQFIRGLYSGGTFCYEATALLGNAWTNTPIDPARKLADPWKSKEHTLVDLGDDVFTRGRPHPMIDHRLRNERLLEEAADPTVAVILLDVVLGYGSHPDPAGEMLPALRKARKRPIALVASVCGTDEDPQGLARQEATLREGGVLLAESNARAVMLASALVKNA